MNSVRTFYHNVLISMRVVCKPINRHPFCQLNYHSNHLIEVHHKVKPQIEVCGKQSLRAAHNSEFNRLDNFFFRLMFVCCSSVTTLSTRTRQQCSKQHPFQPNQCALKGVQLTKLLMLEACCSYTSLSLLMSPFSSLLRHAFFSCRLLSGSPFAWSVAALHLDSETIKLMFLIYEQIVAESIIPLSVLVLFSINSALFNLFSSDCYI